MASFTDQVQLARSLASPDKSVRDSTVESLNHYFSSLKSLSDVEFLKTWKALFYCLWLTDKPLIQLELSEKFASFFDAFPMTELRLSFFKTFLRTTLREWTSLDQHRINKFYVAIRIMIRHVFKFALAQRSVSEIVTVIVQIIDSEILMKTPNGPRFHIIDLFLEELLLAGGSQISTNVFLSFLAPFLNILSRNSEAILSERVTSGIFQNYLDKHSILSATTSSESTTTDSPSTVFSRVQPCILQARIFALASAESTGDGARRRLYSIHRSFQAHTGVEYVSEEEKDRLEGVEREEEKKNQNQSSEERKTNNNNKSSKKKKALEMETETEVRDPPVTPAKGKKEKRKEKEMTAITETTITSTPPTTITPTPSSAPSSVSETNEKKKKNKKHSAEEEVEEKKEKEMKGEKGENEKKKGKEEKGKKEKEVQKKEGGSEEMKETEKNTSNQKKQKVDTSSSPSTATPSTPTPSSAPTTTPSTSPAPTASASALSPFLPSKSFEGKKPHYYYGKGKQGLGYYLDPKDKSKKAPATPPPASVLKKNTPSSSSPSSSSVSPSKGDGHIHFTAGVKGAGATKKGKNGKK